MRKVKVVPEPLDIESVRSNPRYARYSEADKYRLAQVNKIIRDENQEHLISIGNPRGLPD